MTPLRFVTVTELKALATAIVTEVEKTKRAVVITRNGKPVCILQPVKEQEFNYAPEIKGK